MWLWSFFLPMVMAVGLPLALFVSRSVVRSQRGALYNDLIMALFPEGGSEELPQLELVRSKYDNRRESAKAPHAVHDVQRDPRVMILTTLLFCAISFLGFTLLLTPKVCLLNAECDVSWPIRIPDALFWSGAAPAGTKFDQASINTMAIAALGFLGAYVAAAQYLIRQLLNYELEAVSFLRCAFQLGMGVTVSVVAYRAIQGGFIGGMEAFTGKDIVEGPAAPWLGVAFLIGMAPQTGLSWLAGKLKLTLAKAVDLKGLETTKLVPIEVIQGIDTDTKVRLDQSNITDVQNLATRNPIELYIETPYGLLEVFDWVLQAQLCTVVGVNAYDALKKHNIRTIFDLERAVLAEQTPDVYVRAIGEVIYINATDEFRKEVGAKAGGLDADVVRHAVALICDDLHVHRLRALWKRILFRSMPPGDDAWLYRNSPLPGDLGYGLPVSGPLAVQLMGLAVAYGREFAEKTAAGEPPSVTARLADVALRAAKESIARDPKGVEVLQRLLDGDPAAPLSFPGLAMFRADPRFRALSGGARPSAKPRAKKPRNGRKAANAA